jgi:superfamily II DNA or RNA helicase
MGNPNDTIVRANLPFYLESGMFGLRDYQEEAVASVMDLWSGGTRSVLGQAATGLGKSVIIAEIVRRRLIECPGKKVVVMADMGILVDQLAETIRQHAGCQVGIERAEESARAMFWFAGDDVVVATVQTLYSGDAMRERMRSINPAIVSTLILDETETYFKKTTKSREVVDYYLNGNSDIRVYGCTATPYRSDGVAAADLFDDVAHELSIEWAIENGWLVPVKQAFVRTEIDFGKLRIAKREDGCADYSDKAISDMICDDKPMLEIVRGILDVAKDERGIVVCPKVEAAEKISQYLNGARRGSCEVVHGKLSEDQRYSKFSRHKDGHFQLLSSVMMLTKGYDDPEVQTVFMCRPTKSKRLYAQVLGRGTRPLKSVARLLGDLPDAAARRQMIAESAKPYMVMCNLVGIDAGVRDMTIVDILGTPSSDAVREAAKKIMAENETVDVEQAVEEAEEQVRESSAKALARESIEVGGESEIEWVDGLEAVEVDDQGQLDLVVEHLVEHGYSRARVEAWSNFEQIRVLRALRRRKKHGMASLKQCRMLNRMGVSKEDALKMTSKQAGYEISRRKQSAGRV